MALVGSLNGKLSVKKKLSHGNRSKASFADVVKNNPLTGANNVPLRDQGSRTSVFDRIIFQDNFISDKTQEKGKKPIGQFGQAGPSEVEFGLNSNRGQ